MPTNRARCAVFVDFPQPLSAQTTKAASVATDAITGRSVPETFVAR